MSGRTEIERALDGFLAEGPDRVGEPAFLRALDAIDRTNQRRDFLATWRFPRMNPYTRLAAAAVLAVAVVGGALYLISPRTGVGPVAPTATPAPVITASPTAAPPGTSAQPTIPLDTTTWQPFTKSLYGYRVAYPTGWMTSAATELWAGQTSYEMWASAANAPWADKTYFSGSGVTMTGLATTVPAGTSELTWIDAYMAPPPGETPTCIEPAKDMTPITIDGYAARLATRCDQAAFVFVGNRMFVFAESSPDELPLFDAYLSTISLPAPGPSPS